MLEETENIDHFRTQTTLHKREVTSKTEEKLLSKVYESHNAAQIRNLFLKKRLKIIIILLNLIGINFGFHLQMKSFPGFLFLH